MSKMKMETRKSQTNVKLTKAEHAAILSAARKQGFKGLSDYMRAMALKGIKQ